MAVVPRLIDVALTKSVVVNLLLLIFEGVVHGVLMEMLGLHIVLVIVGVIQLGVAHMVAAELVVVGELLSTVTVVVVGLEGRLLAIDVVIALIQVTIRFLGLVVHRGLMVNLSLMVHCSLMDDGGNVMDGYLVVHSSLVDDGGSVMDRRLVIYGGLVMHRYGVVHRCIDLLVESHVVLVVMSDDCVMAAVMMGRSVLNMGVDGDDDLLVVRDVLDRLVDDVLMLVNGVVLGTRVVLNFGIVMTLNVRWLLNLLGGRLLGRLWSFDGRRLSDRLLGLRTAHTLLWARAAVDPASVDEIPLVVGVARLVRLSAPRVGVAVIGPVLVAAVRAIAAHRAVAILMVDGTLVLVAGELMLVLDLVVEVGVTLEIAPCNPFVGLLEFSSFTLVLEHAATLLTPQLLLLSVEAPGIPVCLRHEEWLHFIVLMVEL